MKLKIAPPAAILAASALIGCGADADTSATEDAVQPGDAGTSSESTSESGGAEDAGGSQIEADDSTDAGAGAANGQGSDDDPIDAGGEAETGNGLEIQFSPMYSAFDGEHNFRLPVRAVGGDEKATFTASDPDMVFIEETADGAMITTQAAGTVDIIATAGDLTATAKLFITDADPALFDIGEDRYNNGVPPWDPAAVLLGERLTLKPDSETACTSCHNNLGGGDNDVEHTPQQTGGYSDEDLLNIFTKGKKPEGVPQRALTSANVWGRIHRWQMTDEEAQGIIMYLRWLKPEPQGDLDFGGLFSGGSSSSGVSVGAGETDDDGNADAGS